MLYPRIRPWQFFRLVVLAAIGITTSPAHAQRLAKFSYQTGTIVIYNASLPDSREVAVHYARARGIPAEHLLGIKCSSAETITRGEFTKDIEAPIRAAFTAKKWWETGTVKNYGHVCTKTVARALTLIQGIPLTIADEAKKPGAPPSKLPAQFQTTAASVDTELAMLGVLDHPTEGPMNNPYFKSEIAFELSGLTPLFIVGRIDGPDKATAKKLVDDTLAAEATGLLGRACIDLAQKNEPGYAIGENWLKSAAAQLEKKGLPVILDTWAPTLPLNYPLTDCAYYLGWYTEQADGPFLDPTFRFKRGAIACHIHSFSATSLKTPTRNWCAPLISKGACGVLGNVLEPYLHLCADLSHFTKRLLAGATLGEASLSSLGGLSWMHVTIGDPLYRPFAQPPSAARGPDSGYAAIRLAAASWDPIARSRDFTSNVAKAATKLQSPEVYEFLALHSQAGLTSSTAKAATPHLEAAGPLYRNTVDRIRLLLLKADALRRDGDRKACMKLLNGIIELYPNELATATARAWLEQVRLEKP